MSEDFLPPPPKKLSRREWLRRTALGAAAAGATLPLEHHDAPRRVKKLSVQPNGAVEMGSDDALAQSLLIAEAKLELAIERSILDADHAAQPEHAVKALTFNKPQLVIIPSYLDSPAAAYFKFNGEGDASERNIIQFDGLARLVDAVTDLERLYERHNAAHPDRPPLTLDYDNLASRMINHFQDTHASSPMRYPEVHKDNIAGMLPAIVRMARRAAQCPDNEIVAKAAVKQPGPFGFILTFGFDLAVKNPRSHESRTLLARMREPEEIAQRP